MSTHISPYGHPDATVMAALETAVGKLVFRTDQNYHITFEAHGKSGRVKFSRF